MGWDESLLKKGGDWLWEHRDEWLDVCVVVPTAQAGRKLRESLVMRADAQGEVLLGLRILTPGAFTSAAQVENGDLVERLAWQDVIESRQNWDELKAAFPKRHEDMPRTWVESVARGLSALRRELRGVGVNLKSVARRLQQHEEGDKWQALALLEKDLEKWLRLRKLPDLKLLVLYYWACERVITSYKWDVRCAKF